jgi:hypothetical protein
MVTVVSFLLDLYAWAGPELYLIAAGNNLGLPDEPALQYAESDATQLTTMLKRLGGVPSQNTVLLSGETASTFRRVLVEINARIRTKHTSLENDTVLIVYYSGHADAVGLHLRDTVLPFDELKDLIAGSPAKVRILIVDSCRSGGVTRVKGAIPADEFQIQLNNRLQAEGWAVLTSSADGEDSHESEQLQASFFSHHLLNALRGAADKNRDGTVTLGEAYQYTYQQTLRSSGQTLHLQHPTYQYDIKGKGELVLTRLANDQNRSGQLTIKKAGLYLIMEREEGGRVVAEVSVGREGTQLVLPSGNYFVQQRSRRHYLEYLLTLAPGEDVVLENLAHRMVKYARLVRKGENELQWFRGIYALSGVRGNVLSGESIAPQVILRSFVDMSWISIGIQGRFAQSHLKAVEGLTQCTHYDIGLGVSAQRFEDIGLFSFSFGLLLDVSFHRQQYSSPGTVSDRNSWGFGFGMITSVEIEVFTELGILVEGGPMIYVLPRGLTRAGAEVGEEIKTPLSWWTAAGVGWKF